MSGGGPLGATTGRGAYVVHELVATISLIGYAAALTFAVCVSAAVRDTRLGFAAFVLGAALVGVFAWRRASESAADAFFNEFAPTLGLRYMDDWVLPAGTPLLAAGNRRRNDHTMIGPLFGSSDTQCSLSRYTYEVAHESSESYGTSGTVYEPHTFTVCRAELPQAMAGLRGVYLRRRPGIHIPGVAWHDWLSGWSTTEVDLESAEFENRYELRAGPDQERLVLTELFQPSFVLWLAEHPLLPGFEFRAGTLAVFVPGAESDAARLTQLLEAARQIARRVTGPLATGDQASSSSSPSLSITSTPSSSAFASFDPGSEPATR